MAAQLREPEGFTWHCGEAEITVTAPPVPIRRGFTRGGRTLMAVTALWVPEGLRGAGIGAKLVRAVTRYADAQEVDLWLYVSPYGRRGNRLELQELAAFYERHGFTRVATRSPDFEMMRRAR